MVKAKGTNCESEISQSQSLDTESSELEQDSSDTGNLSKGFPSKETYADYGMGVCDTQSVLCTNSSETLGSGMLSDKLIKLESGDHNFVAVRNKCLSGLSTLVTVSGNVDIYRCA